MDQEIKNEFENLAQMVQRGFQETATKKEVQAFREEMNQRFEVVDERFRGMDRRFEFMDQHFEAVNSQFDALLSFSAIVPRHGQI